jgi:transposase InsO family protein
MKFDLSQWSDSVVPSIKKLQTGLKRVWIMPIPTKPEIPQPQVKFVLKYKKVDKKIRPVPSQIPTYMKVRRKFPEDPLKNLPSLPYYPPKFQPTLKVTQERMDELAIDKNKELLPEEKKLLQHIIVTNERSIAFNEQERGTFRTDYFSDYKMPVIEHLPWQDKNMPIPQGYRDEIIRLLKEKIEAGVYEEAQSSYRSRWFCVKKKNGELRIVHDLQKLNGVSIRDSGVPPILEEFVEAYAGRSIYTVLDMYWGFHARMLDEESRDMTAFQTPLGVLRIVSLPMGYTNSPAEFQACMMFILQDEVPEKAGVFIDDIPIKGPPTRYIGKDGQEERIPQNSGIRRFIWEHLNDVHRILHRLGKAGGTVSGKKMQLCQTEVEIVGHKCSSKGREPIDARTEKVLDWPRPINLKEVRGFLGLCGTVRIWIKDYSLIAKPLVDLTRKDAEFIWGPSQENAFLHLKKLVTSAPVLKPIDYSSDRPVYLSVDTSIYGIGFILSQEDEKGRRTPARYGSLPLKPTEAKYGQSKLELYGLFRALRHYRAFIVGVKNLIVEVDASSIKGMLANPDIQASAVINRWIQGIQQFEFDLVHVPAHKHKGPDALSRRPFTEQDFSGESDPEEWVDNIALITQIKNPNQNPLTQTKPPFIPILPLDDTVFMDFLSTPQEDSKIAWINSAKQQDPDLELHQILRFLITSKLPQIRSQKEQERFKKLAEQFYLQGVQMYRQRQHQHPQVVIFSKKRRRAILWEMHEGNAHHGVWAVAQQTTIRYYWPGIQDDIKVHIQSCHTCQLRNTKKIHLPITVSKPQQLFSKVYLDVMKMPKARGKLWLVACRDDLSGVTECKAIAHDNAKTIAKFFYHRILLRYGTTIEVVTDNGPSFKGEFKSLLEQYGVKQITISPYNSQANGVVERGHFNIREALVKLCKHDISQWPLMVAAACYADRITIRRATGFSPFYLLHGVHPFLPGDLTDATFMVSEFKPGMTDEDLLAARIRQILRMPEDVEKARKILNQSRVRSKKAFENKYAKRLQKESYNPGALVLLRNSQVENTMSIERKVADRYMGPYQIVSQTKGGSYILQELNGNMLRHTVAAFRLIPYIKREDLNELVTDEESNDNESD